jgi:hypothetical protein
LNAEYILPNKGTDDHLLQLCYFFCLDLYLSLFSYCWSITIPSKGIWLDFIVYSPSDTNKFR